MSTPCNGKRSSRTHDGMPEVPCWYMYKLAGNTAISNAMIPHAAQGRVTGKSSATPKITSAAPAA